MAHGMLHPLAQIAIYGIRLWSPMHPLQIAIQRPSLPRCLCFHYPDICHASGSLCSPNSIHVPIRTTTNCRLWGQKMEGCKGRAHLVVVTWSHRACVFVQFSSLLSSVEEYHPPLQQSRATAPLTFPSPERVRPPPRPAGLQSKIDKYIRGLRELGQLHSIAGALAVARLWVPCPRRTRQPITPTAPWPRQPTPRCRRDLGSPTTVPPFYSVPSHARSTRPAGSVLPLTSSRPFNLYLQTSKDATAYTPSREGSWPDISKRSAKGLA